MKFFLFSLLVVARITLAEDPSPHPAFGGGITSLVPLLLMFAIFYFLVIRPQQKKSKITQKFLSDLKRGDMVITSSGIVGVVKNLSEKLVTLEVDDDVCIKVLRAQISNSAASLKDEKAAEEKR